MYRTVSAYVCVARVRRVVGPRFGRLVLHERRHARPVEVVEQLVARRIEVLVAGHHSHELRVLRTLRQLRTRVRVRHLRARHMCSLLLCCAFPSFYTRIFLNFLGFFGPYCVAG